MPATEATLLNEYVKMLLEGTDLNEEQKAVLLQPDRSLAVWSRLVANNGTSERVISAESDGTPKASLYGMVGSTLTAISLAANGEQDIVLHGEDSGSNVDPLRTNADQQLQVEVVPLERPLQLDSVLVPSTEGVLLDGSASLTASGVYLVTFEVANIDGADAVTVDIGVDRGAAGSLSGAEYLMKSETIPGAGTSGPRQVNMAADDDIRGIAGVANDAAIWFHEVVRVA